MSENPAPVNKDTPVVNEKAKKNLCRDILIIDSSSIMANLRGSLESRNAWVEGQEERDRNFTNYVEDIVLPACNRVQNIEGLGHNWGQKATDAVLRPIKSDNWTFLKQDVRPENSNVNLSFAVDTGRRIEGGEIPDAELVESCKVVVGEVDKGEKLAVEADKKLEALAEEVEDGYDKLMFDVDAAFSNNRRLEEDQDARSFRHTLRNLREEITRWRRFSRLKTNDFREITAGDLLSANRK
jgi:hypothetical protein